MHAMRPVQLISFHLRLAVYVICPGLEYREVVKKKHYLPPPMAKESKSPLIKKEFSPVHLKHCREKAKTIITFFKQMTCFLFSATTQLSKPKLQ